MISLVKEMPKIIQPTAESVKINCTYASYKDVALFWVQDNARAVISMLDGDMVIYNNCANVEELREFVKVISPLSVFSDADTLTDLFGDNFHKVCVVKNEFKFKGDMASQELSSQEIYNLLNVNGLQLPPYEHFAVDFCHKLNHGHLKYFALRQKCVAVCITDGQAVLLNGIASHQKGMGTQALCGVLTQFDLPCLAVCEDSVMPFYLKNNFEHIYNAGYWRKNP